jgi:signal transduction histidine kinase
MSIRARLLAVYLAIILIGFGGLALIAGRQISVGARVDFGGRLQNEVILVAQGLAAQINSEAVDEDALDAALADYETRINATLTLHTMNGQFADNGRPGGGREAMMGGRFRDQPELESALRGQVILAQRRDTTGGEQFFTAAPVVVDQDIFAVLQLNVPVSSLGEVVARRWLELGLLVALLAGIAALAAVCLARSIIRPLYALRDSALRLSKGDLAHRVQYSGKDEIGAVAQAFNDMARQVQSMLDEQRAFASNTSHELRTPLTTIRLRSEALRYDEGLDDETGERYIAEIDDEVNRMSALIDDLTVLSRFDAGRAELGSEQIDAGHFASSLQQRLLPQAQARQITLTLHASADLPVLRASLNHLTIVFRNLLENALKYTPDGGCVTWDLSTTAGGLQSVITDNGRGIAADQLPHLFERFYRADKARSRDIPGSGLGLSIVKSVVEAYGGSVRIESAGHGQGTTVTVFWPVS